MDPLFWEQSSFCPQKMTPLGLVSCVEVNTSVYGPVIPREGLGIDRAHDCGLSPHESVVQGAVVCCDGGGVFISGYRMSLFHQSSGQPFPRLINRMDRAALTGDVMDYI